MSSHGPRTVDSRRNEGANGRITSLKTRRPGSRVVDVLCHRSSTDQRENGRGSR